MRPIEDYTIFTLVGLIVLALLYFMFFFRRTPGPQAKDSPNTPRCEHCGYDLRATSTRCPECGLRVATHRLPLDPHKLRDDWTPTPIAPIQYEYTPSFGLLWESTDGIAAAILLDQLTSRGVLGLQDVARVTEQRGGFSVQYPVFRVLVPEEELDVAVRILLRFRYDEGLLDARGEKC